MESSQIEDSISNSLAKLLVTPSDFPNREVVIVDDQNSLERSRRGITGESLLALDCEGIHLGRLGKISLIQVATPSCCYLFDILHQERNCEAVVFLKTLLEDETIVKIIHDCRADSDALYHLLGIELRCVHDTQSWQMELDSTPLRLNLNDTLEKFGCRQNSARRKDVYKEHPSFWATRPLTDEMVRWASEDVATLFPLRERQVQAAAAAGDDRSAARACAAASQRHADELRSAAVGTVRIHPTQVGHFVGKGGGRVRELERAARAVFLRADGGAYAVYALGGGDAAVAAAVEACRPYTVPYAKR